MYAALWTKSNCSFREGASAPDELVRRAGELGLPALALTDRDGVYGAPKAHIAVQEWAGDAPPPKLILGSQVTVAPLSDRGSTVTLLVQDRRGYANLCNLVTTGRLRCEKGRSEVTWREVAERAPGLIALWGGRESLLLEAATDAGAEAELDRVAGTLRDAFGDRLYALVTRHLAPGEARTEARLRARAARHDLPVVAGHEVLYHVRARRALQDVLTCIRAGTNVADAGRLLRPNDRHALVTPQVFARLFADDEAAVKRTLEIAGRCTFTLAELTYRYPAEQLPFGMTTASWLDRLVRQGARDRFGGASGNSVPSDLQARIDRELELIHDLDYEGYFLTMYEIVRFCRDEGIICQGRGSAANSVVCYCLKVTAVNPREVDLLFERFISRERAEPPDIDLDIEHGRREEVIQHVYEKYGRDKAAMVANVVRFRPRSAIREVGKALGLPAVQLDRLAKTAHVSMYYHFPDGSRGGVSPEDLANAGFDPQSPLMAHFARLVAEIQEFPRHLSIHPGGFLLGHEPVPDFVPVENATMADRTVIQWDKYDVEALGLFKVDLLGLGALNQLHIAFDLLRLHRGKDMSLARIPRGDQATFNMLGRADSVGTFQVESRAQMSMLPRLKPQTYYDLVIQVAIIRPGPITGGMLHPFLRRRNGEEPVTYPHPSLEPILRKTLGVPLFQEQVMRLAMVAADYTPGEADQLRRDMATWRSHGPIEQHHQRLVSRMVAKGISEEFAERVFQQIKGFGEYGFPESHAASFALIAYATSWLKCHHPDVFACSLLNAQPMGFYSSGTIVEDAKRHGVPVLPVDVTVSDWDCTLERHGVASGGAVPGSAHRPAGLLGRNGRVAWDGTSRRIPVEPQGSGVPPAAPTTDGRTGTPAHRTTVGEERRQSHPTDGGTEGPLPHHPMEGATGGDPSSPPDDGRSRSLPPSASSDVAASPTTRSPLLPQERGAAGRPRVHGDSAVPAEQARSAMRGAVDTRSPRRAEPLAVRMGLRYVKGLRSEVAARIVTAQRLSPYRNIADLARRARVPTDDLAALARSGALAGLEPDRRKALWAVHAISKKDRPEQLLLPLDDPAPVPSFQQLSEMDEINWDWQEAGHSPRAHLLKPYRPAFVEQGWPTAAEINALPDKRRCDYAGLVICRQRPHTAKGVTFITLEDETGFVNLIVWQKVWQEYRLLARSLMVMGVTGRVQCEDGVTHVIVEKIWAPRLPAEPAAVGSRDFQ